LSLSCADCLKNSWILNLLEPSGPVRACNGIALSFTHFYERLSRSQGRSAVGRIKMTPSGIEIATFRLVSQWRHRVVLLSMVYQPYYERLFTMKKIKVISFVRLTGGTYDIEACAELVLAGSMLQERSQHHCNPRAICHRFPCYFVLLIHTYYSGAILLSVSLTV
jgi:hypothetical protein